MQKCALIERVEWSVFSVLLFLYMTRVTVAIYDRHDIAQIPLKAVNYMLNQYDIYFNLVEITTSKFNWIGLLCFVD